LCCCIQQFRDPCCSLKYLCFRIPYMRVTIVICSFLEMPDAATWSPRPRTTPSLTLVQGFNATLSPYPTALAAAVPVMWGFNPARRSDTDILHLPVRSSIRMLPTQCLSENQCSGMSSLRLFTSRYGVTPHETRLLRDNYAPTLLIIGTVYKWAAITQSVQRLATGWAFRGSNPGGDEIFRTRPDRPWGTPSLVYNGNRVSFPGLKRPGRGFDHPSHLPPWLKKE
jgi:hypothetical protein